MIASEPIALEARKPGDRLGTVCAHLFNDAIASGPIALAYCTDIVDLLD